MYSTCQEKNICRHFFLQNAPVEKGKNNYALVCALENNTTMITVVMRTYVIAMSKITEREYESIFIWLYIFTIISCMQLRRERERDVAADQLSDHVLPLSISLLGCMVRYLYEWNLSSTCYHKETICSSCSRSPQLQLLLLFWFCRMPVFYRLDCRSIRSTD